MKSSVKIIIILLILISIIGLLLFKIFKDKYAEDPNIIKDFKFKKLQRKNYASSKSSD